jgi:hypothetical protein
LRDHRQLWTTLGLGLYLVASLVACDRLLSATDSAGGDACTPGACVEAGNPDARERDGGSTGANTETGSPDARDAEGGSSPEDGAYVESGNADAADDAATPSTLLGPNLVLWLEADKGVITDVASGAVTAWQDQSAYRNHATSMGTDDGGIPLIVNPTGINNLPTIHFLGSTTYFSIPDAPSLEFGFDNVFTWVVASDSSPVAIPSRILWTKQAVSHPYVGFGLYANLNGTYSIASILSAPGPYAVCDQSSPQALYDNGLPVFIEAARSQSALTIDAWETAVAAAHCNASVAPLISNAPVNLTNTAPLRIGGQGGSAQALTGDIAAIIIATGSVTDAQRSGVSDYLSLKYSAP